MFWKNSERLYVAAIRVSIVSFTTTSRMRDSLDHRNSRVSVKLLDNSEDDEPTLVYNRYVVNPVIVLTLVLYVCIVCIGWKQEKEFFS